MAVSTLDRSAVPPSTAPLAYVERKYRGIGRALLAEAGIFVALTLLLVVGEIGLIAGRAAGGGIALLLALAPVPLLYALGLWLDRFEPEPPWLLMRTFLWGAAAAALVSGLVNDAATMAAGRKFAAVISAPLIEEAMKGAAVLFVFRRRREHLNDVLDGVVYALFVGLGFAAVENVHYYVRGYGLGGEVGLAVTVVVRGVLTPFLHPFFTMFTGVALALARRRTGIGKIVLPILGFGCAVYLHSLWNAGIGMQLYPVVLVPAFFIVVRRILRYRRAQAAMLLSALGPEVDAGLLSADDLRRLHAGEIDVVGYVRCLRDSDHPLHCWRRFHHAAFALAAHRDASARRAVKGEPASDADRDTEQALRAHVADARRAMLARAAA